MTLNPFTFAQYPPTIMALPSQDTKDGAVIKTPSTFTLSSPKIFAQANLSHEERDRDASFYWPDSFCSQCLPVDPV